MATVQWDQSISTAIVPVDADLNSLCAKIQLRKQRARNPVSLHRGRCQGRPGKGVVRRMQRGRRGRRSRRPMACSYQDDALIALCTVRCGSMHCMYHIRDIRWGGENFNILHNVFQDYVTCTLSAAMLCQSSAAPRCRSRDICSRSLRLSRQSNPIK